MTDRKLMQQALHTLEGWANVDDWVWPETAKEQAKRNTVDAIAALRERLAQPEQEPVAWYDSKSGWTDFHFFKPVRKPSAPDAEWLPLYTTPPQRPPLTEWQPIETAPKTGKKVVLFYLNRNNLPRTVMARWLTDEQAAETDADGVGLEGGWYECIDNWDDYTEVAIHEGEPSRWMPLPAPPIQADQDTKEKST